MKHARVLTLLVLTSGFVVVGSCTSQPVILPSRDFDRPTDLTFVCMGTFSANGATTADGGATETDGGATTGAQVLSGRPMRECHPRGTVDIPDQIHHTFGFLPNSAIGSLSVIDADRWSLVNLDPANAGFNRLPLGVLPSQIASSDDGCRLVTANAGSCDFSFVDPAALLAPTVARESNNPSVTPAPGSTIVTNVFPKGKKSGRELRVRAGEVAFLPTDTTSLTGGKDLCSADKSRQWQALATFPSCDLVALIDLPSGYIQKAAYTRPTKDGSVALVPLADGEDPVCPVDCGYPPAPDASPPEAAPLDGGAEDSLPDGAEAETGDGGTLEPGAPDASAAEAGAPAAPPPPTEPGDVPFVGPGALRPGPIAIVPESGRAYVGLANAAFVLAFGVGPSLPEPSQPVVAIPLHEDALGVSRVRLSIDPYKDKTTSGPSGAFVGNDHEFDREYLYVVARDGTLRVVQVANALDTECETNLDFTLDANAPLMNAACPPVTGPAVRRPGVVGPGIRLPSPPIDVAVVDIRSDTPDQSETSVSGAHAYVLTASGAVYLLNIDPVLRRIFFVNDLDPPNAVLSCPTSASTDCQVETPPPPNTLRNANFYGFTPALISSQGPARLDVPPAQSTIGPRIETIWTRGTVNNATALTADFNRTEVFFPDQVNVTPQTWTVTWQGNIMASPRATGQLRTDSSLVDLGVDFCRLGVEDTDIVTLLGCTADAQCGINKKCVLGSNGAQGGGGLPITGLCLSSSDDRPACDDLLSTVKRYDVTSAQQSVLQLEPHKDELVRPALQPCSVTSGAPGAAGDGGTDAGDAAADARSDAAGLDARDGGADGAATEDNCHDPADPSTMNFSCVRGRCLYPCDTANAAAGCRPGRICLKTETKLPVPKMPKTQVSDGGVDPELCDTYECYCADAPELDSAKASLTKCLGELTAYQVGVGRGFAVAGSQAGLPATGAAGPGGHCQRMPGLDPRVNARISMDDPVCTAPPLPDVGMFPDNVTTLDSRCDPNLSDPGCPVAAADQTKAKTNSTQLVNILKAQNDPNPCQYIGGPNETDTPGMTPTHVKALFRNRELHFGMTNLEHPPSGTFQIRFDVHGGFQAQQVFIPPTVEVTMPARILLGPFDAANPANPTSKTATTPEVPWLFVVDQRRLGRAQGGGPTRGQLLRINPRGNVISSPVSGAQPWFEDLSHSNNEFPIQ
jgi:hypothetical protein